MEPKSQRASKVFPLPRVAFAGLGGCQNCKAMEVKMKIMQRELTKALQNKDTALQQAKEWQRLSMEMQEKNAKLANENLTLTTEHEKLGKWMSQQPAEAKFFLSKFSHKPRQPSTPPPQHLRGKSLHAMQEKNHKKKPSALLEKTSGLWLCPRPVSQTSAVAAGGLAGADQGSRTGSS